MKPSRNVVLLASFSACLLWGAGCRKSTDNSSAQEAPITGKPSDPPVEMKAQWKPGRRYLMHLEMNQSMLMPWGRQPTTQEMSLGQDYAISVTNAPDGGRGLELEIQSLALDVGSGETTWLRFDSLNKVTPNEGPGVEQLEKLIGGRIRLLVDATNKVTNVEGVKELAARVEDTAGAAAGGRRGGRLLGGMLGPILQRIYSAEYFKQILEAGGLPQGAVRIGETWSVQKEIPGQLVGTLLLSTTNKLRGWQQREGGQCARIEFAGTLATKSGQVEGIPFGGAMKVEGGQISGTSWFSPDLGLPVESAINQSYNVTGTLPNWGGPRRGGTNAPVRANNAPPAQFTSPVHQTISVKLTEVPAPDPAPAPKPAGAEQK